MVPILARARMARAFFALVRDPTQTQNIFFLSDMSLKVGGELLEPTLQSLREQEGFLDLYREAYRPPLANLRELERLPDGTFGREFARHMTANNLDVDFFPALAQDDLASYGIDRVRRTHDLWHVLVGFDTRVPGELGLQAFTLAQLRAPLSAVIIAGGILHVLTRNQSLFYESIDQIVRGYRLGLKCRPLLGIRLEERWSSRLVELRQELGLAEMPSHKIGSQHVERAL